MKVVSPGAVASCVAIGRRRPMAALGVLTAVCLLIPLWPVRAAADVTPAT